MEYILHRDNFENEAVHAEKPVLIDFFATWCGPCRMVAPIVAEIAEEHPEIKVCKVNVDEEPELASLFHVASIPTLAAMQGGKVTGQIVGYRPKEEILALFGQK